MTFEDFWCLGLKAEIIGSNCTLTLVLKWEKSVWTLVDSAENY